MSLVITAQYIDDLGVKLTHQLGFALENDSISMGDLPKAAMFIHNQIFSIKSHPQLVFFLEELTKNWDFFSGITMLEKGKVIEEQTQQKVQEITKMIEDHNLDQAILTAKQVAVSKKTV